VRHKTVTSAAAKLSNVYLFWPLQLFHYSQCFFFC